MTNPDIRAAFEAWAAKEFNATNFERGNSGGYINSKMHIRWESWQACAASLSNSVAAVELFGYGSSKKKNCLLSKAQFDSCAPKNRTAYDIPLYAYKTPSCATCNDHGSVGRPPDDYWPCPDCAPAARQPAPVAPMLTVWEGAMPESNGKSNFTAVLHRKGTKGFDVFEDGFTIARSEYPGRVRYEADCMRYLIGELTERPCIINYDSDTHSGYVAPERAALAATAAPALSDEQIDHIARSYFADRHSQTKAKGIIHNALLAATRSQP